LADYFETNATMYCYRFPDRDTFLSLALASGHASQEPGSPAEFDEEGNEITPAVEPGPIVLSAYTHEHSIDEIGPVVVTEGVYDDDGIETTPPVIDDRHHINFKGVAPESWDEYLIVVNSPYRVWAGSAAG
jgi:hypothetical protein